MSGHNEVQLKLYEFLRDELSTAEHSLVEAHLATCSECMNELQTLREAITFLPAQKTHASGERSEEFWTAFATSVTEQATQQKSGRKNPLTGVVDWLAGIFLFHPKYTYAMAGVCAIMVAALTFWTFAPPEKHDLAFDGPSTPLKHQSTPLLTNDETAGEQEVPAERVSQYFKKSKMLLVGFSNMKTNENEPLDFSTERRVSRDLVREARYLKRQPIDPRSRRLMNDLERILIELENIEEKNDLPNVEIIRGGIHQENLLFKIRMAEAMYDSSNFMYTSERR